jgi:hypothetical protein
MSLTPDLRNIVADLDAKIEDKTYSVHARDVFKAIKDCIITHQPIDRELQEQYVSALANYQAVNRFGQ